MIKFYFYYEMDLRLLVRLGYYFNGFILKKRLFSYILRFYVENELIFFGLKILFVILVFLLFSRRIY